MFIFDKDSSRSYLYLFFVGLISSLAFAPTYLFFVFFFSFNYLLEVIVMSGNCRKSFLVGWMFGFGYFIGNCYWYCSSLLVEAKLHAWLIPFAITVIPSYLALYTGATAVCIKCMTNYIENRFVLSVLFSVFWTIFEYLRGIIFSGFPWNIISYSLGFSPLAIQTVSIFGSYIFGFFVVLIYSSYWVLKDSFYSSYAAIYLTVIVTAALFGYVRLSKVDDGKVSEFKIRLVQPNIQQEIKNSGNRRKEILKKLLDLSLENSDDISYVIWPETAVPYGIFINKDELNIKEFDIDFSEDKLLISGAIRVDKYDKKIYNSIIFVKDDKIVDYYDKNHLVPFGEYLPFRKILPSFVNSIAGSMDISKSDVKQKIVHLDENLDSIAPIICYESIFTNMISKKANVIVNVTNDAWFGKSSGSYQHFEVLKFRALENNMPVIRVANSGISGVIDRFGRVVVKTKLGTVAVLDVVLPEY